MSRRDALQEFIEEVVPAFRDRNAWEDLAWNVIGKLTAEQLAELKNDYEAGLMVMQDDEWVV